MPGVIGFQREHSEKIGRLFLNGDPLPDHVRWELGFRKLFPVLSLHLRNIDIGPNLEGEPDGHMSIVRTGRVVIEKIINSGKLNLDWARHGICYDFCTRPRIVGVNLHYGRGNLRKLRDG